MAIKNLRCTREDGSIAVIWAWDMDQENAQITVTRLLDGEEVACRSVSRSLYQQAINSPRHGPVLKAPPVPLRVTVRDSDGEESVDLTDRHYTVTWSLRKQNIYQRKRFFGQELVRTDVWLRISFPYEGHVPQDLFYYVLTAPGKKPGKGDPIGYLPELRPGTSEYGVIALSGRSIHLCCNPDRQEVSQLFHFSRQADQEQ